VPDIFNASKPKKDQSQAKKQTAVLADKLERIKENISHKSRSFSSFIGLPNGLKFDTQEDEEQIILLLRRHPITNIPWILLLVLLVFIPIIVFPVFFSTWLPMRFQIIVFLFWYLFTFAYGFQQFLSWYFNVDIITNERIVSIVFLNILYREINQCRLTQVEDSSVKIGSFIRSLFDFGDIAIQTAGEVPNISIDAVPHPTEVVEVLNELLDDIHPN